MTLLLGMACLDLFGSFSNLDKDKVLAMARSYLDDFESQSKIKDLSVQLHNFLENSHGDLRLSNLIGISDLCRKLIETKKYTIFSLVFLLVKLAHDLALPLSWVMATSRRRTAWDALLRHALI